MDNIIFIESGKISAHPVHGVIFKKNNFYIGILQYKDKKKGYISFSEETEKTMQSFFDNDYYIKITAEEADLEILHKRLCFNRLFKE
jgi:hypothetical protein